MSDTPLNRFLGGSPAGVITRLILISLVVGAAMAFFGVTPADLLDRLRRFVDGVLGSGIESLHTLLLYVAYGAMVVVPIFIIVRLLKLGRPPR